MDRRIAIVVWLIFVCVGIYLIYHGWNVVNTPEPIEKRCIWRYAEYPNGMNAGNLSLELTSDGRITALKPINVSIDLHWFYPDSSNDVFSIYFWGAYPEPEFPFNATIPPPTSKIILLHYWTMPENHFMDNVTLVWMTSGVFGATIEEIGFEMWNYNMTQFIEIEPASAASEFKDTHARDGQFWIGIGLTVFLGSTIVYQVNEQFVGKKRISKAVQFKSILSPHQRRTILNFKGNGTFQRMEIQANGNPASRMLVNIDDSIHWDESFESLYQKSSTQLRKYVRPSPSSNAICFVELSLLREFSKNVSFSVKNVDEKSDLTIEGTAYFEKCGKLAKNETAY
jgi:hypothetical protein